MNINLKFSEMEYKRLNMDRVRQIANQILVEFQTAQSGREQFKIHKKYYILRDEVTTTVMLAKIRHDMDTSDEYYCQENSYYNNIVPELRNLEMVYLRQVYESPYREYLARQLGRVVFKNMKLTFSSIAEELVPLMKKENALVSRYDQLIARAKFDWNGEILNLSLLKTKMQDQDRKVREKAYKAYTAFFMKNGNELDTIYDELVQNRTEQAKKMGFKNYLNLGYKRLNRNCYSEEDVVKFRNQVKQYYIPFVTKIHEERRKRLGLGELSYIDNDIYFLNGNPVPQGTQADILANGKRMYNELSQETKEFIDFMMENELFDVSERKNKKDGSYMTVLPKYNAPFVFANFNGTSEDVNIITHELGHAFQAYLSLKDPIREHGDVTTDIAEIHSMSMEFFAEPWMDLFYGKTVDEYRKYHFENAAIAIPYACMVDEFQQKIYENPEMTCEERHGVWKDLENVYRPHLHYDNNPYFEKGGFWQKQLHIYGYPLYFIDYAIAQFCAFQYMVWMKRDYKGAWNSYMELCRLSASDDFIHVIKKVGLDNPFETGYIKKIVKQLEQILPNI